VYVELPKVGETFEAHEAFGSVESVKAVSEIFMPVSGEVVAVNESLQDEPEKVNTDPYGDAWMVRVRLANSGEIDSLLSAAEYEDFTKAETE
jgi:glycine cleavage system H protein